MLIYTAMGSLFFRGSLMVTVASLVLGLIFFRLFTPFADLKETKAREDDLFTITLSLIITLWIGKIVTHLFLFIKNPQAVLAYPADKYALYAGLVMTGIYIFWHYSRKEEKRPWPDVLLAALMVIISGQFLFGFLTNIFSLQPSSISYIAMYAVLLVVLLFGKGRVSRSILAFSLLSLMGAGHFILGFFWKGALFQFYPGAVFWIIILLAGVVGLIYESRRTAKIDI